MKKRSIEKKPNTDIKPDTLKKHQSTKGQVHATILQTSKKNFFSALKNPFAILSFILNLIALYSFLVPDLILSINMPQNTEFPFEIFLKLINTGHFEVRDVDCKLDDIRMTANVNKNPFRIYTPDPQGKVRGIRNIPINRIKPKTSESIDLRRMFGLIFERTDSASFSITITYSVWYLPFKKFKLSRHYELVKTITGAYDWQEKTKPN